MLTLLLCTMIPADAPKFSTPEPTEIPADLRQAGKWDEKYPIPQDEALIKSLRKSRLEWYQNQIVKPFESGAGARAANAEVTRKALTSVAEYYARYLVNTKCPTQTELREQLLATAIKGGADDPILVFYHALYVRNYPTLQEKADSLSEQVLKLEKHKAPPFVQARARMVLANTLGGIAIRQPNDPEKTTAAKKAFREVIPMIVELARDEHSEARHYAHRLIVGYHTDYQNAKWGREEAWNDIQKAMADAKVSDAFQESILGFFYVKHAWDARGTGLGGTVTAEGSRLFRERLTSATEAFEKSYDLDPKRWSAPTGMLNVCLGLGQDREEMEKWFQRAMTANPDNYEACNTKLTFLQPRWHGSNEDAITFGRQLIRTRNHYAGLPYMMAEIYRDGWIYPPGMARKISVYVKEVPSAWADLRDMYEYALHFDPTDRELLSEFAYLCTATENWDAAKQHIASLKNKPAKHVFPTAKSFSDFVKNVEDHLKKP